jgi:SAM-dependent methyltransferase
MTDATEPPQSADAFWESFYADGKSRWSGNANASLVADVEGLAPGRALDLGCGQGGDAIWLAQRGWTVTAVDISATALATAERHAREAGVDGAIRFARHDLAVTFPDGAFDLVATTFLHSPVPLPRARILQDAARAVAPGGTLLVIGHAPSEAHPHADLPTLEETLADLALPDDGWTLGAAELRSHRHAFRDEEPVERVDVVVRARRRQVS